MGSYDQPKAYFGMADRSAAKNSTLAHKSAASNFKSYMAQKSNSIRAVRAAKDRDLDTKSNPFWGQYQSAFTELSAMESALGGQMDLDMTSDAGKAATAEITAFKMQIQMQLEKIGAGLTKEISGKAGRDMSEADIQALIGQSVGRVQKLQSVIVNVLGAAEEYYNAPEGTILSSSNPELQLLFDGLKDDKIDMIFGEDDNGDWSVYPVGTHDSRTGGKAFTFDSKTDTNKDGVLDEKDKVAQARLWAEDKNNTLYRGTPGTPDFQYNYIKDIGPLNLTRIERDFKSGTGSMQGNKDGAFFNTVGNYKTLSKDYDAKFASFLDQNKQGMQAVQPDATGKKVGVAKKTSASTTMTGKNAKNLTNQDQSYMNRHQVEDLLNSTAGEEFLDYYLNSETLDSDYAGWIGGEFDLLSDEFNSKEKVREKLRSRLIEHSLKGLPQPLPDNSGKLIDKNTGKGSATPITY